MLDKDSIGLKVIAIEMNSKIEQAFDSSITNRSCSILSVLTFAPTTNNLTFPETSIAYDVTHASHLVVICCIMHETSKLRCLCNLAMRGGR